MTITLTAPLPVLYFAGLFLAGLAIFPVLSIWAIGELRWSNLNWKTWRAEYRSAKWYAFLLMPLMPFLLPLAALESAYMAVRTRIRRRRSPATQK